MSWTDERIATLTKMWEGGATASQIADELGGVSRTAVIGKAHRLGLGLAIDRGRRRPGRPGAGGRRDFGFLARRGGLGLVGLDRRRARLEPKAVRLADHRVARHAAQLIGDLACGGATFPHLG